MSEQVMVLGKVNKGINKTDSGQSYESAWLGRWKQLGNEVKCSGESSCSKELIRPEGNVLERKSGGKEVGVEVLPFPMLKVSQKRESSANLQEPKMGSSSNAMANRTPWMYAQGDKRSDFPIQEKTTQNLLELVRPVSTCAMVDFDSVQRASGEINLPEEDCHHKLLKGSTASMRLKGKLFGGYLDLFPHGGARLQCLESPKGAEEDGAKRNESSAETDTLEMDRLQIMHLAGSISSSSAKGKGRQGDSAVTRTEIPDMNEEPPLVLDREDVVDEHLGETSNSVTQSMNVDHFLSRECKRVRLEPETEPSSRWVKRLKTNASSSSSGNVKTKNLMEIDEASRGQKENKNLFLEILKSGINNLQPRKQEPDTSQIKDLNKGEEDITLLHPWIQRWCKKKATSTSTDQTGGQEVRFEPENQKELEKKQYPSIAAMALMGKALTGLNPYGLRKTDSLMVWNSRDLR